MNIKDYLENLPKDIKFKEVVNYIQEELGIKIKIDILFYENIKVEDIDDTVCKLDDEYSFCGTLEEYENEITKTYGDVINDLDTPYDAIIKYRFNENNSTLGVLVFKKEGYEMDWYDYIECKDDYDNWDEILNLFLKGDL